MTTDHGPKRPRPIVVALHDHARKRPEAPLAIVGPFPDADAARAFTAEWDPQLRAGFTLHVGSLPEHERLPSHMATIGALDDPDDGQCPHRLDDGGWCCLRGSGHRGEHVFHVDRLLERRATADQNGGPA